MWSPLMARDLQSVQLVAARCDVVGAAREAEGSALFVCVSHVISYRPTQKRAGQDGYPLEMSGQGFPFQADALALARWDYCEAPEAVPAISDPLSCALRTRQCGSHIAATGDRAWMGRATRALASRQEGALVSGWEGKAKCVEAAVPEGSCSLMTSARYGQALWETFGRRRAERANAAVQRASSGAMMPAPQQEEAAQAALHPPVFGSDAWLVQHYDY